MIYGSEGELSFSVLDESEIIVNSVKNPQTYFIENPENIQLYHVQNMKEQLLSGVIHPSNGNTATHTSWVMDQILKSDN